jgi:Protein of unknown function (DUF4238)
MTQRESACLVAMFMGAESDALALLRDLQARWPLTRDDRVTLGQFVAIHIVRTPSFAGWLRQLGAKTAGEVLAEEDRLDEEQTAQMEEMFRGDRMHARTLLRQIPRIGSVLCSMHWSVVEFHEDWLISSDQPVVLLPPPPHSISPASVIPPYGVMGALEGRFTLDPRRALLLSWREEQDEPWLNGTRPHACSINCALKAQALKEWFCVPGTRPPFISPRLFQERVFPISGYSAQQVIASRRRQGAERLAKKMVEEQTPDNEMRWVRVRDRPVPTSTV